MHLLISEASSDNDQDSICKLECALMDPAPRTRGLSPITGTTCNLHCLVLKCALSFVMFIAFCVIGKLCCFLFSSPRLVCVTGRSVAEMMDAVQVTVDQALMGTSKERYSYLVSCSPTHSLCLLPSLPVRPSVFPPAFFSPLCLTCLFAPCSPQRERAAPMCRLSVNRCVL